jgi:hypothetical protein
MSSSKKFFAGFYVAAVLVASGFSATDTAQQIVEEMQRRTAVNSIIYEGLLQVTNAHGKTTEKQWQILRVGPRGSSKTVIRFTSPDEVKGVALLIISHPDRNSDQWMWTPSLNRERRVGLQDRSARFFDTDFSFEDLEERNSDQYNYELAGEATVDDQPCWIIHATPKQGRVSQYTSSSLYVRHQDYAIAQLDNYSGNEIVRSFKYQHITNILGIPTPLFTVVSDLRRHRKTVFRLDTIKYNSGMNDQDFTLEGLRGGVPEK